MIDFLLGGCVVVLVVRGWLRGLIRQALELAVLVAGLFLALRLSGALSRPVGSLFGTSPLVSRLVAGAIIFVTVSLAAAVVSHISHRTVRALPGMPTVNRAGGAALGAAWGIFLVTVVLTGLAVAPIPSSLAAELDDSAVATVLTDPSGLPQRVLGEMSGDSVVRTVIELRSRFDADGIVAGESDRIPIPPAAADAVAIDDGAAQAAFALLNSSRVEAGLDPLAWSPVLADVASGHAIEMYRDGYLGHESPVTGRVEDRVRSAGAVYRSVGENLALGVTVDDVHRSQMDSPAHRANVLDAGYRRVAVAVVSGPLGLMTVVVFTG